MPTLAPANRTNLEIIPTLPAEPVIGTQTGRRGEGGEHGEGLKLCIHVRASRARVNPPRSPYAPRRLEAIQAVNCAGEDPAP
jgi:hypothetical protein